MGSPEEHPQFTTSYPFYSRFLRGRPGASIPDSAQGFGSDGIFEVKVMKRVRPRSIPLKLPTLRFRGKIILGFVVVLAISAVLAGVIRVIGAGK